ncbi:hypothetical protein QE152_g23700 [Popillia japonica]|uniref:Uncharacterized protein n=1 Tax=Popillia japonica TaxID=7064 RepID=A0AAW1KGH5_POPJA
MFYPYWVRNGLRQKEKQKVNKEDVFVADSTFPAYSNTVMPIKLEEGRDILLKQVIPPHIYAEIKKTIKEKTEEIRNLEAKVANLERILRVRNAEITNLTSQLRKLSAEYYTTYKYKSK